MDCKICSKCSLNLPLTSFHRYKKGYKSICKPCTSNYNKQYYSRPENKIRNSYLTKRWIKENIARHKANISAYQKNNKPKIASKEGKRRAAKLKASVKWADNHAILELYSESSHLTYETGIKHHVDHIIPLQGVDENGIPNVCGLHVETNLQILTIGENCTKSNLFIPLNLLHNTMRYLFYVWICTYIRENCKIYSVLNEFKGE